MAIACVEDFRAAAKRRLPRFLFDYIDGGSYAEVTLAPQRRRSRRDRAAPAGAARRLRRSTLDHLVRPQRSPCRSASARSASPACMRGGARRSRRARGGAEGASGLPLQPLGLLAQGGRGGGRRSDLVPALRDQGPRLHGRASGRGQGGQAARRSSSPSTCRCPARATATSIRASPAPNARRKRARPGAGPPALALGRGPARPPAQPRQFRAGARPKASGLDDYLGWIGRNFDAGIDLEGRRVDPPALAGPADRSRASSIPRTRARR